jgi:hypothetical protein
MRPLALKTQRYDFTQSCTKRLLDLSIPLIDFKFCIFLHAFVVNDPQILDIISALSKCGNIQVELTQNYTRSEAIQELLLPEKRFCYCLRKS